MKHEKIVKINKLIWDGWNRAHITKHLVQTDEVEQVCQGKFVIKETYGGRLMLIGKTLKKRFLMVVLSPEGDGVFYVVTARTADKKERRIYDTEID